MYRRTSAFILKSFDYKETDAIVTLFSSDLGKVSAIAKGVKKPRSSLRGTVQPFCFSQVYLVPSGDLYLLTQGRIINFFGDIREDFDKTMAAVYLLELVDKSLLERDPNPRIFQLLHQVLEFMDENPLNPLILRYFELRLLSCLGYGPNISNCCKCSSSSQLNWFNSAAGGILCSDCAVGSGGERLLPATLAAMRSLMRNGIAMVGRMKLAPAIENNMEVILGKHLEYYLEKRFNVKNVMRDLKTISTD